MKSCCKLHGTRPVYNLDLIKLILKNTTVITFFFPREWLLVYVHSNEWIFFKGYSLLIRVMSKMVLLCPKVLDCWSAENILHGMEGDRGRFCHTRLLFRTFIKTPAGTGLGASGAPCAAEALGGAVRGCGAGGALSAGE